MKPYHIPVSTCVWDPKWFHDFQSQSHKWIDKNGVINGLRLEYLHPGPWHKSEDGCEGRLNCKFDPKSCLFIEKYREQLFGLDRDKVYSDLNKLSNYVTNKFNLMEDPIIVFIVHEDPTNPCSERSVLQEYFNCTELDIGEN